MQPGLLRPLSSKPSRIGSAQASPALGSVLAGHQALPVTSLRGDYLYIVVQVTRDLHPVVCSDWVLPGTEFELGVGDVTLMQFQQVAARLERDLISMVKGPLFDWTSASGKWMIPLAKLLEESPLLQFF